MILIHLNRASGGVVLLFSKHFLPESYDFQELVKGRLMAVKAKYECFKTMFVNVYAPNMGPERILFFFYTSLNMSYASVTQKILVFLARDFNCTENDQLDRNHLEPHVPRSTVFS